MTRFIYKGLYYPVIGSSNGWTNYKNAQVLEYRVGGWKNADKWWSFSIGIKCRLFNPKKPYFQFVIDTITKHPEMVLETSHFEQVNINSVYNLEGKYIGNIRKAYFLTKYIHLQPAMPRDRVVSIGFNKKKNKWVGWSHRAMCAFGIGDILFDPKYGNKNTPFKYRGEKIILTFEEMKQSAINFAEYVS